jgi:hypothetical protein
MSTRPFDFPETVPGTDFLFCSHLFGNRVGERTPFQECHLILSSSFMSWFLAEDPTRASTRTSEPVSKHCLHSESSNDNQSRELKRRFLRNCLCNDNAGYRPQSPPKSFRTFVFISDIPRHSIASPHSRRQPRLRVGPSRDGGNLAGEVGGHHLSGLVADGGLVDEGGSGRAGLGVSYAAPSSRALH